jgi:hypothetical protein
MEVRDHVGDALRVVASIDAADSLVDVVGEEAKSHGEELRCAGSIEAAGGGDH